MAIEKVNIIGGGVMGMGIGQALAQQGLTVTICETVGLENGNAIVRI